MGLKASRAVQQQLASIPAGEERLILATGRYIGEGFDDARFDTLFLALPVSWKGTLVQYTGRLHRVHPGKADVRIFDYVDRNVPMLLRMFQRRLRGYRAIGYARGDSPVDRVSINDELIVEYDGEMQNETDIGRSTLAALAAPSRRDVFANFNLNAALRGGRQHLLQSIDGVRTQVRLTAVVADLCGDAAHHEYSRPAFDSDPGRARLGVPMLTDDTRHVRLR